MPKPVTTFCTNGCGRHTSALHGVCYPCRRGEPLPCPDVKLLPVEYLVECSRELVRRHAELGRVVEQLGRTAA